MELQLFFFNENFSDYETAVLNADQTSNSLAAVSFFYEISATNNTAFDSMFTLIGTLESGLFADSVLGFEVLNGDSKNPSSVSATGLETLGALLPEGGLQLWDNYYYYSGSRTLPRNQTAEDCTEPVLWIVYEKTIPISETQLTPFRRLLLAANGWSLSDAGGFLVNGTDPPCVHNFRPTHPFFSNDTVDYFCDGDFLCALAQTLGVGGIAGGGTIATAVRQQVGQVGISSGRKSKN